jgi:hypothetical protein
LPAISRSVHFAGPALHARRLVELWKVDAADDVPLAQAFRLLDVEAVAWAILRTLMAGDYSGDPRHWVFPPLVDLLPELQELAWQAMLDGALRVEAVKGVRGTRPRLVLPAELPRLRADWGLSRLVRAGGDDGDGGDGGIGGGGRDEFIDVRVRRPAAELVKPAWRPDKPSQKDVDAGVQKLAQTHSPGSLSEEEFLKALAELVPGAVRTHIRAAVEKHGSGLIRPPGRPRK